MKKSRKHESIKVLAKIRDEMDPKFNVEIEKFNIDQRELYEESNENLFNPLVESLVFKLRSPIEIQFYRYFLS
jgi:hypothetical protein